MHEGALWVKIKKRVGQQDQGLIQRHQVMWKQAHYPAEQAALEAALLAAP